MVFKLFITLVKFKAKEKPKGYQTQFNIQFESLNMNVVKWKSRNLLSHLYSLIHPPSSERHTKSHTWFCLIKAADSFILSSTIWNYLCLSPNPSASLLQTSFYLSCTWSLSLNSQPSPTKTQISTRKHLCK